MDCLLYVKRETGAVHVVTLAPRIGILSVAMRNRRLSNLSRVEQLAGGKAQWHSGKELACPCRRCRFYPWVGKIVLEKETETHSSMLSQKVPEEPGRLQSMRLQRVRRDLATKQPHYPVSFPP